MKWKCVFENVIVLSLLSTTVFAQNENYSFIPSANIAITHNKTTNLIFPFTVQSVDRGSKDILVQQPKGTENIIQLKANKPNFTQTNLSVITVDGMLYSFTVDYAAQPSQLNIIVENKNQGSDDPMKSKAIKLSSGINEASYKAVAQKIAAGRIIHVKKVALDQMKLRINGIYVNKDIIYFRLYVNNNSNVSYDIDNIRFSIKDRIKSTRTATQEIELNPVYTYNKLDRVGANSTGYQIIAVPKFTLPDSKFLSIQMFEKNGSRNLNLALGNRNIMRAAVIKD